MWREQPSQVCPPAEKTKLTDLQEPLRGQATKFRDHKDKEVQAMKVELVLRQWTEENLTLLRQRTEEDLALVRQRVYHLQNCLS